MHYKLNIINPKAVTELSKQLTCDDCYLPGIKSEDFEIPYLEIRPIKGYTAPAKFPYCCSFHKGVFETATKFLQRFPNCCEKHKRLLTASWFNKRNYEALPHKVVNALSYTGFHISQRIDSPNWYQDITDYIAYCKSSFGQLPDGYGGPVGLQLYLNNLKSIIQGVKYVPEPKRVKLLEFLDHYDKPVVEKETGSTDLNILIATYKRWLKIFPFEISYFSPLKGHFANQLPMLKGEPVENPYTGMASMSLTTSAELISFLISVTETIITEINSLTQYEKGLITDIQKTSIEIINANRRLELKELKEKPCDERRQYINTLKQWFNQEKGYLAEIAPLLKDAEQQPRNPKNESKQTKEQDKMQNGNRLDLFLPIDEGNSIYDKVPFEIGIIYKYRSPNAGQRFIGIKGIDYKFYTEVSTYNLFWEDFKSGELYTEELKPLTFENIYPYYKSYSEGFVKGYRQFDDKISSSTTIFKNNTQIIAEKIFDCINEAIPGLASYGCERIDGKLVQVVKKDIWFDAGAKAGEKYKAWYFVINNYRNFINLFRTYKPYISFYRQACEYWKNQPGGEGMYSTLAKLLDEIDGNTLEDKETTSSDGPNNFLKSTIEDYLDGIKTAFNTEADYKRSIEVLETYFKGEPYNIEQPVFIRNGFKRKLAFALGEIYRSQKNDALTFEYLDFSRKLFTIYKSENIRSRPLNKTNLYKYFTSKS